MKKKILYTEYAWILGLLFLTLGTALMERADFGMSSVVAPAYILYRKVSQTVPFFTFGMAEYSVQAVILIVLALVLKRGRKSYLFSFVTAVIYGCVLDLIMIFTTRIPDPFGMRVFLFIAGSVLCSIGVAFYFKTYITPAAYELTVSEITAAKNADAGKVKLKYDLASACIAVLMSFLFFGFGHFEGIKPGTIVNAAVNGPMISFFSRKYDERFEYRDRFGLRQYFEK